MQSVFLTAILLLIFFSFASALKAQAGAVSSQGRWIVVCAPAFLNAIQPLIEHRKAEGFDVTVINIADVLTADEIKQNQGAKLLAAVRTKWGTEPAKSYVLLVGTVVAPDRKDAATTQVPCLMGSIGRMKGLPTDNGFGCREGELLPAVAVGRWPVCTVAEAKSLVIKTLAFEEDGQKHVAWRRSINLLVGSPGGASPAEKSLGNWYVNNTCQSTSQKINPLWTVRSIYHIPASPWYVSDNALHEQSLAFLNQGQTFTLHLGHSSPDGFWSNDARFLDREDWKNLNMPHGAGVLMTCGCFACQLDAAGREDHDGFGLAAIRSAAGPVAVIGSTAESYSVAGYCAFNGLFPAFSTDKLPDRLGQCWLNVKGGIANGPVTFFTQKMFDYGDGSNGDIALDTQRKEHLEMWTLLGDPAMRLPSITPEIVLHVSERVQRGQLLKITGELPGGSHAVHVHLTLERPLGMPPPDLAPLPKDNGPQRDAAIASNFKKSQNLVLIARDLEAKEDRFATEVAVPPP